MSNLLNGFMHRPFEDNKYFGYKEDDAFEKKRHFCVGSAVSHRIRSAKLINLTPTTKKCHNIAFFFINFAIYRK